MKTVPIVLICYNRPWHTFEVLKALEEHNVQNLIIFSDAPKSEKDTENVFKTRSLFESIRWTKPEIILQEQNQGLAKSIVSAVDYALETYDSMILLEDDCVPQKYFFDFIYDCLIKYEDLERVFGITGYSVTIPDDILKSYPFDLYFFPRIGSWGWATWRTKWNLYEKDIVTLLESCIKEVIDLNQGGIDIPFMLKQLLQGHLNDVWTLNWVLTTYLHQGCFIYPTKSHIVNIGMDGSGLHCGKTERYLSQVAVDKARRFPSRIFYDSRIFENFNSYYDMSGSNIQEINSELTDMLPKLKKLTCNVEKNSNVEVLHIIQSLSLGGASRAMIAAAKYSARLGQFKHSIISLLPPQSDGIELAKKEKVHVVSDTTRNSLLQEIRKADIVHLHFWNTPEMYDFLRSELPEMRLLIWFHIGGDRPPQIINDKLVDFADFALACSPYTYQQPAFIKLPETSRLEKTGMVYGAADFERLKNVRHKKHETFNIGYIGLVHFTKLHRNYVPMSASINIPNIRFVVCGGGIENHLRQEAKHLGAAERFDFRGYVDDVKSVIEILDVYGYPLCEDTYAAAELNLQEVMFAGVPPVVFPYGGVKDLVLNNFTGLVVHSEPEYKQAVEYLYHHPEERLRIGKNARAYAKQIFGAENAATKLNPIYDQTMKFPKKNRKWKYYVNIEGNLLDKPVSLSDITDIPPKLSGSEAFIESLGDEAQIFATSRNSQDIRSLLEADKKIANSSEVLVFAGGGIQNYSDYYPDDGYFRLWKGLILQNQGHHMDAISEFSSAIKLGCNNWRLYWYTAQAAEKTGDPKLAMENLQKVIISSPEFTEAKEMFNQLKDKIQTESTSLEAGKTALFEGKPDIKEITPFTAAGVSAGLNKSQPVSETTEQEWPEEVVSLVQKAEELIAKGNLSDLAYACDAIDEALGIATDDPILIVTRGKIMLQMGDSEAAHREFDRAARLAPDFVPILLKQMNIEYSSGQKDRTVDTQTEQDYAEPPTISAEEIIDYTFIKDRVDAIEGLFIPEQEEFFFNKIIALPDDAVIVETGSYKGRSTVIMGYACKGTKRKVYSIHPKNSPSFDKWKDAVQKNDLDQYVKPLTGVSDEVLEKWHENTGLNAIDFIFFGGSQNHLNVLKDFEAAFPLLKKGGWVAFERDAVKWPGSDFVWNQVVKSMMQNHEYLPNLVFGQKSDEKAKEVLSEETWATHIDTDYTEHSESHDNEITNYASIKADVEAVEGFLVPGQEEFLFNKVKSLPDDAIIVEIGSHKGRSTVSMGYACKGTKRKIYCIDPWPNTFNEFISNINKNKLENIVIPFQGLSQEILTNWHGLAGEKEIDFIFIDGSHEYLDVLHDFELAYPLVKDNGWLAFHDVIATWPGSERVWNENVKPILINHEYSTSLACGQKKEYKISFQKIHIIGDSHAFSFQNIENCVIHHLGPVTMHRIGRDGINIKDYDVNENDYVVFFFGEIDVRCHIGIQRDKHKRDIEEITNTLANKFVLSILKNQEQFENIHFIIYSVVPPTNAHYNPTFPFYGTLEDRIIIAKKLNSVLKNLCKLNKIGFIDIYNHYSLQNGEMNPSMSEDAVHIHFNCNNEIKKCLFAYINNLRLINRNADIIKSKY